MQRQHVQLASPASRQQEECGALQMQLAAIRGHLRAAPTALCSHCDVKNGLLSSAGQALAQPGSVAASGAGAISSCRAEAPCGSPAAACVRKQQACPSAKGVQLAEGQHQLNRRGGHRLQGRWAQAEAASNTGSGGRSGPASMQPHVKHRLYLSQPSDSINRATQTAPRMISGEGVVLNNTSLLLL